MYWQPFKFFIECISALFFFHYLILEEDGMLSSNKPHWNPMLPKANSQILLIYWNNFRKIFPRNIMLNTVFRLLNTPKFQIFFAKSNTMVKDVRYWPKSEAAVHRCLQPFTGINAYSWVSLSVKLQAYSLKKGFCIVVFLWVLPNISEYFFLQNTFG